MVMYFGVGKSLDSVPEEFMARAMLYVTSFEIFKDFSHLGRASPVSRPTPLGFIIRLYTQNTVSRM